MRILTHDPQSSDTTRQVLQDGPFFLRKVFSRRRGLTKVQRQTWWFPPPSPSSACAPRTQAGVETGPGVSVKDAAARRNSVRKRAVDTASRAAPCVFARVCGSALCASAALRSPSAAWARAASRRWAAIGDEASNGGWWAGRLELARSGGRGCGASAAEYSSAGGAAV